MQPNNQNPENKANPQAPKPDSSQWPVGYFPYSASPQTPKPVSPPVPAAAPARPGEAPRPGVPIARPGAVGPRPGAPASPPVTPSIPPAAPPPSQRTLGGTSGYGSPYANRAPLPPLGTTQTSPPIRKEPEPVSRAPEKTNKRSDEPSSAAPPKRRRSGAVFRVFCLLILCVLVGGGSAYFVTQWAISDWEDEQAAIAAEIAAQASPTPSPEPPPPTPSPTPPPQATPVRTGNALSPEAVYEVGRQPVVGITTEITTTNVFGQATTGRVSGSGFIVSTEGYILTNYHVIEGATRIWVMLDDYSVHEAELIGGEGVTSDMAVLKIDATHLNLTAAVIGNSSEMRVGSPIFAIGNPLGELTFTMTSGIVSALNREVAVGQGQTLNMFQIDAPVNSGNSGGPVYNEFGEVVGIVTAKAVLEGVEGIGFAIPIDDAMHYADLLIELGYIPRPHLGIFPVTVTESYAQNFGTVPGVSVNTVYPDTAAERGGMLEGDIITAMNGTPVRTVEELRAILATHAPGDTVIISVFRYGEHLELSIILGDRPPEGQRELVEDEDSDSEEENEDQ